MLITTRIWICLNVKFVLRVKRVMFITVFGPYFAGFGAVVRGQTCSKEHTLSSLTV